MVRKTWSVAASSAWAPRPRPRNRTAETEIEQRILVAQVLETKESDAPELAVVDPERVIVLVAVCAVADRGLDVCGAPALAHMERELVPCHEFDEGVAVRTGGVEARQGSWP